MNEGSNFCSSLNFISRWSPSIASMTLQKNLPTLSNYEAISSNSDSLDHRMILGKFLTKASITTSVHLKNVSSDISNNCANL